MTRISERSAPQATCTVPPPRSPARRSPAPPPQNRPRTAVLAAGALAVMVGIAMAMDPGTTQSRYQAVGSTGEHPFTSPVGADESVVPVLGGGARRGDSAGLYQQDLERPACDGGALTDQLEADPGRVGAWTRVQRTTPARLTTFVAGLTPVVLRADTAVVDHGYRDGASVPTPAVLAAGTAVFVDGYGRPTVKCWSGNPLTPGSSTDRSVTTVDPSAAPITTLTVLDPAVDRLVGRARSLPTTGERSGRG